MTKLLEEFDGEPTLTAENEIVFDTLYTNMTKHNGTTQGAAVEIPVPETASLEDRATNDNTGKLPVTDKAIRRAAKDLIHQQGAWAFKMASDKAQEAAKAGELTVQRAWRRIGWAILEIRPSLGRGAAVNLTS